MHLKDFKEWARIWYSSSGRNASISRNLWATDLFFEIKIYLLVAHKILLIVFPSRSPIARISVIAVPLLTEIFSNELVLPAFDRNLLQCSSTARLWPASWQKPYPMIDLWRLIEDFCNFPWDSYASLMRAMRSLRIEADSQ